MPAEQWGDIRDLFHAVLERPCDARAAYLDEVCDGNTDLRARIEAMVAAQEGSPSFLEAPTVTRAPVAAIPRRIDRYDIKRVIASGGMGTVYEAAQDQPHRLVALKVLRHGAAMTDERAPGALRRIAAVTWTGRTPPPAVMSGFAETAEQFLAQRVVAKEEIGDILADLRERLMKAIE